MSDIDNLAAPPDPDGVEQRAPDSRTAPPLSGATSDGPGPFPEPPDDYYDQPAETPRDITEVDWHAIRCASIRDRITVVERQAKALIDRIESWKADRLRVLGNRYDHHAAPIRSYHEMLLREDKSQKTLPLAFGKSLITTRVKPQVFIDPEHRAELVEWAQRHLPDVVRHDVKVTDLRKAVQVFDGKQAVHPVTGEVVPGVTVAVPDPSWSLDLDTGDGL